MESASLAARTGQRGQHAGEKLAMLVKTLDEIANAEVLMVSLLKFVSSRVTDIRY